MATTFDRASTRRLVEATKYVEQQYRSKAQRGRGPTVAPYRKVGITTSLIGGRSGKTPGSGTVQPYLFNGTTLVTLGMPVTVYNWTGSSTGSGIWVEYEVLDGHLFLCGTDCSGVAS